MFQVELKASYANRVAVVSQNQILQSLIAENLVSDP
ncbi:MAG TPA: TetR family transcriptional regulator, partial [Marinobacter adhaerens]|nr:TetR family transcriptional regulator [Marinobacter adhaerens]